MHKHASVFGSLAVFVTALLLASPLGALAAKPVAPATVDPASLAIPSNGTQAPISADSAVKVGKIIDNAPTPKKGETAMVAAVPVAAVSIFADPTNSRSSGSGGLTNFGAHSWITVKNISGSSIRIGNFNPIPPGKTMSIGTWGNVLLFGTIIPEHTGMYYDLESYHVGRLHR